MLSGCKGTEGACSRTKSQESLVGWRNRMRSGLTIDKSIILCWISLMSCRASSSLFTSFTYNDKSCQIRVQNVTSISQLFLMTTYMSRAQHCVVSMQRGHLHSFQGFLQIFAFLMAVVCLLDQLLKCSVKFTISPKHDGLLYSNQEHT